MADSEHHIRFQKFCEILITVILLMHLSTGMLEWLTSSKSFRDELVFNPKAAIYLAQLSLHNYLQSESIEPDKGRSL